MFLPVQLVGDFPEAGEDFVDTLDRHHLAAEAGAVAGRVAGHGNFCA